MKGLAVAGFLPPSGRLAAAAAPRRLTRLTRHAAWLPMVGVAAAESILLAMFAYGLIEGGVWFAAHACLVAALAWGLKRRWRAPHEGTVARMRLAFLVTTAALGPVGAIGGLLTTLLLRAWGTQAPRIDLWLPAASGEDESARWNLLVRRLSRQPGAGEATSRVAPFADVMARGSIDQKQVVIALMANRFKPSYAPVLLGALSDADPSVRVLAAAAAARIENEYLPRSMHLEERYLRQRSDFTTAWKLATHHDEYANTGLFDETRTLAARLRALKLYRECATLRPTAQEVKHAEIRLLVRLGRDDEAEQAIAPLLADERAPAETLTWYVEGLFKRGRFGPLRDACRLLQGRPQALAQLPQTCRDAVRLWAGDTPSQPPSPAALAETTRLPGAAAS